MKNRELTIEKLVNPSFSFKKATIFSLLRLKGKWLLDSGFVPGDKVTVKVETNRLIIERRES